MMSKQKDIIDFIDNQVQMAQTIIAGTRPNSSGSGYAYGMETMNGVLKKIKGMIENKTK